MPDSPPRPSADPLGLSGESGRILHGDMRLSLVSTDALGQLRHELYETLGPNMSHEVLFRLGFQDGSRTALAVRKRLVDASPRELLVAGPVVHDIRGMARVTLESLRFKEEFESLEGTWEDSFEANHSLRTLGAVDWTVCWILTGFASGYASEALDRDIVCVERTCRGKGDPCCRFEALPAEHFPGLAEKVRALRGGVRLKERVKPEIARLWEKAHSSSTYLAQILKDSADAILTVDSNEIIQSWNRGAVDLLGYAAAEAVGRHFAFLVPPDLLQRGEIEKIRRETSVKGSLRNYETRRVCKDGREVHVSLTRTSIHDALGEYVGSSAILRDITERHRLVQQLIQAESLAEVGEMTAQVAHEIKNPLAGISAAIQLLSHRASADDPRVKTFEEILEHIARLDHTVRSLLEFTRPYDPTKESVPMDLLLDSALALLRASISGPSIELRREISPEAASLHVDPQLFVQVLQNLLLNAAHALDTDDVVVVRSKRVEGDVVVEIRDHGKGIAPETLRQVFKPFFTTKSRGTGLGLPLTRKIVEAHGGAIAVHSKVGEGTTVIIRIP